MHFRAIIETLSPVAVLGSGKVVCSPSDQGKWFARNTHKMGFGNSLGLLGTRTDVHTVEIPKSTSTASVVALVQSSVYFMIMISTSSFYCSNGLW